MESKYLSEIESIIREKDNQIPGLDIKFNGMSQRRVL
jgi:hypothetical protein